MKVGKSAETYQVGAHFKALIKAILVAPSRTLEKFFSFHVSLPRCAGILPSSSCSSGSMPRGDCGGVSGILDLVELDQPLEPDPDFFSDPPKSKILVSLMFTMMCL